MLRSGMLNVRRLLGDGVAVSLGTDVSGGASPSMLSAIREALKVSNLVSVSEGAEWAPLTYAEAFWLATVGGAQAVRVDGLSGDLSVGSVFDAVVVDPEAVGTPVDLYDGDAPLDAFQKWLQARAHEPRAPPTPLLLVSPRPARSHCAPSLQLGDDRNTAAVYVAGKKVL